MAHKKSRCLLYDWMAGSPSSLLLLLRMGPIVVGQSSVGEVKSLKMDGVPIFYSLLCFFVLS